MVSTNCPDFLTLSWEDQDTDAVAPGHYLHETYTGTAVLGPWLCPGELSNLEIICLNRISKYIFIKS